ncbi:MAG: glycosyltransferase family 2 protein [Mycobacterium sp.]
MASSAAGYEMTPQAAVTVSLVSYNGMAWLPGCLASLDRQTLREFELLVLDNASDDGSLDWLHTQTATRPWMTVGVADRNLGFAAGQNRNIYDARGEFVCLLNQDVELDASFLEQAVAAFVGQPRLAAVQGKLLRLTPDGKRSHVIDSTGLSMFRSRRVVSRAQGQRDHDRWSVPGPVWGADGPAPVYRRAALMDVQEPRTAGGLEILDEDLFMYKEDVDLAWRIRRRGWSARYQPAAIAWHARTAGAGDASSLFDVIRRNRQIDPWIRAMSWRNQRLMQLKNESLEGLALDAPWLAVRELASAAFVALFDRARIDRLDTIIDLSRSALRKRGTSSTAGNGP